MTSPALAHGVGTVYELPLPLGLYLAGAAAVVVASFGVRVLVPDVPRRMQERTLAEGPGPRRVVVILRALALVALVVTVVLSAFVEDRGFSAPLLLFWIGLVIGMTIACAVVGGLWKRVDPWATIRRSYLLAEDDGGALRPPSWLGPIALYLLFWFELVSGSGFEPMALLIALLAYTVYSFTVLHRFGDARDAADPFAILFGFASRISPLYLHEDRLVYRGLLGGLDEPGPMPRALFASLFVLLGSTTLDNVRESVGWFSFQESTGLDSLPDQLVDSVALLAFAFLFFATFSAAIWIARSRIVGERSFTELATHFGWSLVPIGIAYVLAHNAPLVITGTPALVRSLSDPLGRGWNLFGTADLFENFLASPRVVWFLEIALIVGGHILAVIAAHRKAVRLGSTRAVAVRGQYALTVLMAVYTIATLWLLAQPLVV